MVGEARDYDAGNAGHTEECDPWPIPRKGNQTAVPRTDPQSWNGYSYAGNNPLRFTDPFGEDYHVCDANGKNCGDLSDTQYNDYLKSIKGSNIYVTPVAGSLKNLWSHPSVRKRGARCALSLGRFRSPNLGSAEFVHSGTGRSSQVWSEVEMAIHVPGQPCSVCGRRIEPGEATILLPPFTSNDADPLFKLSDALAHASCVQRHPEAERLNRRLADFNRARSERVKRCIVCGQQITNPDYYFTLGYLGEGEPAQSWNYANFHGACLSRWAELPEVVRWTDQAIERGEWTKASMRWLQTVLREAECHQAQARLGSTE